MNGSGLLRSKTKNFSFIYYKWLIITFITIISDPHGVIKLGVSPRWRQWPFTAVSLTAYLASLFCAPVVVFSALLSQFPSSNKRVGDFSGRWKRLHVFIYFFQSSVIHRGSLRDRHYCFDFFSKGLVYYLAEPLFGTTGHEWNLFLPGSQFSEMFYLIFSRHVVLTSLISFFGLFLP